MTKRKNITLEQIKATDEWLKKENEGKPVEVDMSKQVKKLLPKKKVGKKKEG